MGIKDRILASVFAAALVFGLGGAILSAPRPMWNIFTQKDESGQSGCARLETVLQSNIPFHAALSNWEVSLRLLSGQREIDHLFFTNNRLIENIQVAGEETADRNLEALRHFADVSSGSAPCLALIPTACAIQQELLPDNAILFNQKSWIEKSYETLSQELYLVEVYPAFYNARGEELYYRTDSRTTTVAGYKLYTLLAERLNFYAKPLSDFSIVPLAYDCLGDLYARWGNGGVRPDAVSAYVPADGAPACRVVHSDAGGVTDVYYSFFPEEASVDGSGIDCILGGESPRIDVTAYQSPTRSLLIFGDQDILSAVPFLSLHYSRITIVNPADCSDQMLTALAAQPYDQTLFAFSASTFLTRDLATPLAWYEAASANHKTA